MPNAQTLRSAPADLGATLDTAQAMRRHLAIYGITCTTTPRPGPAARWDPHTLTIDFRDDCTATTMQWAIRQLWLLITVGPHAATGYTPTGPRLRLLPDLIPSPRRGS